jgi:hypothetical protein
VEPDIVDELKRWRDAPNAGIRKEVRDLCGKAAAEIEALRRLLAEFNKSRE